MIFQRSLGVNVGDVNNAAAAGRQGGGQPLAQKKRRLEVAADQIVPVRLARLAYGGGVKAGGVVDQGAEGAEAGESLVGQGVNPGQAAQVCAECLHTARAPGVELVGQAPGVAVRLSVVNDELPAGGVEAAGYGLAYAARASGN